MSEVWQEIHRTKYRLKIVVVEVVLGDHLGAASQGLVGSETQVVGVADVIHQAVVAGEDDAGAVASTVWFAGKRVWALHEDHIAEIIAAVTVHQDAVLSLGVGHGVGGVGDGIGIPVLALQLNMRICRESSIVTP